MVYLDLWGSRPGSDAQSAGHPGPAPGPPADGEPSNRHGQPDPRPPIRSRHRLPKRIIRARRTIQEILSKEENELTGLARDAIG